MVWPSRRCSRRSRPRRSGCGSTPWSIIRCVTRPGWRRRTRERLFERERRALALARGIVVTSRHTAARLADFDVPADRIRVVRPGVEVARRRTVSPGRCYGAALRRQPDAAQGAGCAAARARPRAPLRLAAAAGRTGSRPGVRRPAAPAGARPAARRPGGFSRRRRERPSSRGSMAPPIYSCCRPTMRDTASPRRGGRPRPAGDRQRCRRASGGSGRGTPSAGAARRFAGAGRCASLLAERALR